MPISNLSAALTAAQVTAINTALDTIINTIKAVSIVNLTPEERQSLNSIDQTRYTYVDKAINIISTNTQLAPPYSDRTEALKDWTLSEALKPLQSKTLTALELVSDMKLLAEHESYQYLLDVYATIQQARTRNVPGADTAYDELSPLFEKVTTSPTPPAPPTP
jgi:hypothetical protein